MDSYLRIFLVASLTFGLFSAVTYGLEQGVIRGIVFGGITAFVLGMLQHFAPRGSRNIHQTRTVDVPLAYDQAFDLCLASIDTTLNGKITIQDRAAGLIEARTGLTWKSFGEDILFTLRQVDEKQTQIRIASRPIFLITWVDYGKNAENVERIITYLAAHKR